MAPSYKPVFIIIAAVTALVGVLGLMDLGNVPYSGFFGSPTNHVTRVFPGSPAEEAGLRVGDELVSVGGIEITDTRALARRPRAEIGEVRTLVVERDGRELELDVVYSGLPALPRALAIAAALIGYCFLLFPLWAYLRSPSKATMLLALFGLCFGIAFVPGPYSPSYFLRTLAGALATSAVILGFAFLVHFLLQYPRPRPFLQKAWSKQLIYIPAILLALFFLFLTVAQPDGTASLNQFIGLLVGVFVVGFFGWAMVAMIQSFLRASPGDRARHGLGLMLLGILVGLIPVTFSQIMATAAPEVQANLPGVRFYFLSLGLIPLCFALATLRAAKQAR